jgi:hypothetical protein
MSTYKLVIDHRHSSPYRNGRSVEQVSDYLEDKYGIKAKFMEDFREEINRSVVLKMIEHKFKLTRREYNLPVVEDKFKQLITNAWFDGKLPGTPTKASLLRKGKRRAKGGRSTPSFVDTGKFRQTIRAKLVKS